MHPQIRSEQFGALQNGGCLYFLQPAVFWIGLASCHDQKSVKERLHRAENNRTAVFVLMSKLANTPGKYDRGCTRTGGFGGPKASHVSRYYFVKDPHSPSWRRVSGEWQKYPFFRR